MPSRIKPHWYCDVKKALIDNNLTITKLADELGVCRVHASHVINGRGISKTLEQKIFDRLNLNANSVEKTNTDDEIKNE